MAALPGIDMALARTHRIAPLLSVALGTAQPDLAAMFAQEWSWCQLLNGFSNRFHRRPAIESFREIVPEDHDAFGVGCDHSLLHGIEQLSLEPDRSL